MYVDICNHPHKVVLILQSFLTLSHHKTQSSIATGSSSWSYPEFALSWCMKVLSGKSTLMSLRVGIQEWTSLMCSSLLLQQNWACIVIWMAIKMEGQWLCICCLEEGCFQNLLKEKRWSFLLFPSIFFSIHFVNVLAKAMSTCTSEVFDHIEIWSLV